MTDMWDRECPLWRLLYLIAILFFAWLFSYTNATNFDKTEYKMLLEFAAAAGGMELLRSRLFPKGNSNGGKKRTDDSQEVGADRDTT